jgi:flagellar motor switch/type III secretory pathway protein FliN
MKILPGTIAGLCAASLLLLTPEEINSAEGSLEKKTEEGEIAKLQKKIRELEESLALRSTEADHFHQQWVEMRLRNEALGLEALSANEQALEEKTVRLVGELYRSEKLRFEMEQGIVELIDAGRAYLNAREEDKAERRAEYENAIRSASRLLQNAQAPPMAIAKEPNGACVTHYRADIEVAILNVGRGQGAKVGMPMRILRGDRVIGRGKIVEVREYLSAFLVEDLVEEKELRAGDRVLLETNR